MDDFIDLTEPTDCALVRPMDGFNGAMRLSIGGDIDCTSSAELARLLRQFDSGESVDVLVDLGRVTFFDTTGITFLMHLQHACRDRQGEMTLCSPTAAVRRALGPFDFSRAWRTVDVASDRGPARV